jgi:hypothetical protein
LIPGSGRAQEYDAPLSNEGYQQLVQWNTDLKVEASYAAAFEALDLHLPCCDWSKPG